jgi:surfeit locus 1 family protein
VYGFLLRPRWIAAHLVVLAAIATFSQLGTWQLRRLHAKRAHNALVSSRTRLAETTLEDALARGDAAAYRRVRVTGRYDPPGEVLLRGPEHAGAPGFDVLTPLRTGAGAIVVNRGWVPFEMGTPPVAEAAPPSPEVEISGVLMPTQRRTSVGPKDPPGRLRTIGVVDLPRLQAQSAERLAPYWLLLETQSPRQDRKLPIAEPLPEASEGSHLYYAVQWFAFMPILLVTYLVWLRGRAKKPPGALP